MSCAAHAIENAIKTIEQGKNFEEWASWDTNLHYIRATPEEVWEMAMYAYVYSEEKDWWGEPY